MLETAESRGRLKDKAETLPPTVYPFRLVSNTLDPEQELQIRKAWDTKRLSWWVERYRNRVPRAWTRDKADPLIEIMKFMRRKTGRNLQQYGPLYEAIVTCPASACFEQLAFKVPLSARFLALGLVNGGYFNRDSEGPTLKWRFFLHQKELGVKDEEIEKAIQLAKQWESKKKILTADKIISSMPR